MGGNNRMTPLSLSLLPPLFSTNLLILKFPDASMPVWKREQVSRSLPFS